MRRGGQVQIDDALFGLFGTSSKLDLYTFVTYSYERQHKLMRLA